MVEKHFDVSLPSDLVEGLGWKESEVPERVREALVMELLRLDRISEAEAAEILNLDRWSLLEAMGKYRVPAVTLTPEELAEELGGSIQRNDSDRRRSS